ncbi:calpain-1 catalytic subunit-like [Physella acuta]|uniref:calpain-1 catalytic subunit-like n=1 Tax=Physella acuta TaxID=109671 RepID=UPI0027DE6A20|nr:calpain-1 catalytic subunit-like [Physella acuta]XP_059148727.1 calpain-1 catalytic subunit-like [Physella acuta]XP_059148728.1 calpain-1 catalytic subunit-like [Physella acuta]
MGCGTSQPSSKQSTNNDEFYRNKDINQSNHEKVSKKHNREHDNIDHTSYNRENYQINEKKLDHRRYDDDYSDKYHHDNEHISKDVAKTKNNDDPYIEKPLQASYKSHRQPTPPPNQETPIDYTEDDTPFDDDGIEDQEDYSLNSSGLMVKTVDFRGYYIDEESDEKPRVDPGNLFVDEEFPLEIAIVQDNQNVEWKRPKEFVENPQLFTEGSTRFDIGQGTAGTCYFLSIVADIADKPDLIKQVIPDSAYYIDDPDRYDGVFHARFFQFGKWEDVYIDDYLPVVYDNVLWGAKSSTDSNEMWVALLEKAFARLHGSYDAIYGGQPGDAYLQLTGGIGERIELDGLQDKASSIFTRIKNALGSGCQLTCVVPDEYDNYKGLVGGHAYSLVGAIQAGNTQLIRVRNPWGHGEWKGAWCDGSPEWNKIPEGAVKAPNKDDGEFYVCLSDFMKYFSQTTICSLTPDFDMDGSSDSLNHILSIFGEWRGPQAAGFHKLLQNPRIYFSVTDQGVVDDGSVPFVVQMIQHSRTVINNKKKKTDNISMRCDVFKVLGDKIRPTGRCIALEIQGKKNNVYTPELQTSFRFKLKPGRYMIIPSTVDEGLEKAFLLRLFSPAPILNVKEIPQDVKLTSCENEETLEVRGKVHQLTFEKTLFGEFINGVNAGGQVSNQDSYQLNPQYLIIIPDTGRDVPIVIHVMQDNIEPQYPIGIRLFQIPEDQRPPLDTQFLYENYNSCPTNLEGAQSKFMISWDVDSRYVLAPGRYIALVHLDEPGTEKSFTILFKSTTHVSIKGFQTD